MTGMKVPWYVNMDTSTCLATWALLRRLTLPADLRPVLVIDRVPTRPRHPRHMGSQAHAVDADVATAQPQPQLTAPTPSVPGQLAS